MNVEAENWRVMLCKPSRAWSDIVDVSHIGHEFLRPVEFKNAGIFVEVYRLTEVGTPGQGDERYASADYVGLRRLNPLWLKYGGPR
jgi:hypothetical protein